MATQRVNFFQRSATGAPLTAATITTSSRYDDNSVGPVIGNAVELSALNQPGFYYFDVDVAATKRLTVVTDAGVGVSDPNLRYTAFVLDDIDPTARNIANQTWDTLTASHVTAGSFGLAVGTTNPAAVAALPSAAANASAVWAAPTSTNISVGSFGLALGTTIQTTLGALPTAAANADAVWDEATAGHAVVGSFGEFLGLVPLFTWQIPATTFGGPMGPNMGEYIVYVGGLVEQAPDLVWDVNVAAHVSSGTYGLLVGATIPDDIADVAPAVWDVTLASHVNSGSTGEALDAAASGGDPATIAAAVWAAMVASNQAVGSFGQAVTILEALAHRNWRLTGATYSGTPPRLTSATMVLYPTKADAIASTNAILTQAFTATYDINGEMTTALQSDI